jgi:hypothetical protein
VIIKRRKVLLWQRITGLMIFPWLETEEDILVKTTEARRPFVKLKNCCGLDGRVLWTLLMCGAFR